MIYGPVQRKILAASAAAYCIANIGWWLQPALIHEVATRYGVKESAAGLVASAEMTVIALSSILFAKLIGRFSIFHIALTGVAFALAGTVLSIVTQDYTTLLISRAITGLGEGGLLAASSAALACFADPDRAYGKINIVAILFGSASIFSLSITANLFGIEHNVFPTILVGIALSVLFVPFLRNYTLQDKSPGHSIALPVHGILSWKLLSLLIAVFTVAVTSGSMWSFYYLLGDKAGLTLDQIHGAVSTAAFLSVLGAVLATVLGTRYGRFLPLTLGIIVLTLTIAALSLWHQPLVFRIGATLNIAGTYFLMPYFLGYAAAQDPSGRDSAMVASVFLLTGAVGPALGGYIIETFGVSSMAIIVICTNTIAWRLFLGVNQRQRNRDPIAMRNLAIQ